MGCYYGLCMKKGLCYDYKCRMFESLCVIKRKETIFDHQGGAFSKEAHKIEKKFKVIEMKY